VKVITRAVRAALSSAVALSVVLSGCGGGGSDSGTTSSALSGVASTDVPVSGTVSLKDSSTPAKEKTTATDGDGAFSFDVSGLTPPYMLRAEWTDGSADARMHSAAPQAGTANINPLTDAAVAAASGEDSGSTFDRDDPEENRRTAGNLGSVLSALRTILAPLFDLYHVGTNPLSDDSAALRAMLRDVRFSVASGSIVVTNRKTGGVIFSGPLTDLASGTFHPENMPGGSSTPPPPTPSPSTCTYTYSAWGACQSSGTQTRTVLSSAPAGCTGTPALSQSCVYTPPAIDGAALYAAKCAGCHGPLATSSKRGRTAAQITAANMTQGLSPAEVQAVADALATTTPAACTSFTYSTWGTCQPSNTQTRTVLASSPTGCTGGSPVLSQACTYVPPVATCTSFTYSTWGTCQSSNTQTRTVASSSPTGCTGGAPVLSQACTYFPPVATCTSFTYSAWGACQSSNTQTRTVASSSPTGCTGGAPILSQACTYVPPPPAIDGTALYASSCAGCHGALATSNLKGKGISLSLIKSFGMTQGLSDAQLQAIVTAVGP